MDYERLWQVERGLQLLDLAELRRRRRLLAESIRERGMILATAAEEEVAADAASAATNIFGTAAGCDGGSDDMRVEARIGGVTVATVFSGVAGYDFGSGLPDAIYDLVAAPQFSGNSSSGSARRYGTATISGAVKSTSPWDFTMPALNVGDTVCTGRFGFMPPTLYLHLAPPATIVHTYAWDSAKNAWTFNSGTGVWRAFVAYRTQVTIHEIVSVSDPFPSPIPEGYSGSSVRYDDTAFIGQDLNPFFRKMQQATTPFTYIGDMKEV